MCGGVSGLCVYNDGTRYEGSFQNDKRHGRGTLYYPEGTKLVGEFRDDEANGEGTLLFKNGDKYEGTFKVPTYLASQVD